MLSDWRPTYEQIEAYKSERSKRKFGPYSAPNADLIAAHAVLTPDQPAAPDNARNEAESLKASATLQDSCNAPDEDAAVRAAAHDRLCRVMAGENANEIGSRRQYANRILDAGWTDQRPVDTRITVSQYEKWFKGQYGYDPANLVPPLVERGIIIPDPAPAAEVPVFDEMTAEGVFDWIAHNADWSDVDPANHLRLISLANALAAALTKATDR